MHTSLILHNREVRRLVLVRVQSWFEANASRSIYAISPRFDTRNLETYARVPKDLVLHLIRFRCNTLVTALSEGSVAAPLNREHLLLECPLLEQQRSTVQAFLPEDATRSLPVLLQGGRYPDASRQSGYLAAHLTFLEDANQIIVDANHRAGTFDNLPLSQPEPPPRWNDGQDPRVPVARSGALPDDVVDDEQTNRDAADRIVLQRRIADAAVGAEGQGEALVFDDSNDSVIFLGGD
ncbi:hypothetical protein [Sporisorium scitamineum]|uniref:Uncharacterized protein n=1 Tax=Sporisorium scitamineum TaxID=49012 RepID=A0A0F7RUH0_9BASI|nr:hypothetical protein [Sporisorium scitamineum]